MSMLYFIVSIILIYQQQLYHIFHILCAKGWKLVKISSSPKYGFLCLSRIILFTCLTCSTLVQYFKQDKTEQSLPKSYQFQRRGWQVIGPALILLCGLL